MILRIIGSMAFCDKYLGIKEQLEQKGHQIILPRKDPMPKPVPKEHKLKTMHEFNEDLSKSDGILVMNYSKGDKINHIGVNTLMEIGMAFNRGKKIFVLNSIPEFCKHELEAIDCKVLDGKLDNI